MIKRLLGSILFAGALFAGQQPYTRVAAETNVNSRYTVESVALAGDTPKKISNSLREALQDLVGSRFDAAELEDLAIRLRRDLHLRSVTPHVVRGSMPDQVKIVLELKQRSIGFDVSVPKFLYHSRQGWSAEANASTTIARTNNLTFGIVSDGDELTERFAGINTRYQNLHVGSDRVRFQFQFESYHEQWNRATLDAIGARPADSAVQIYRTRQNYEPAMTFVLAQPLTLTVGASFQQMEPQIEAPREAANAAIMTLRYHRHFETSTTAQHDLDAGYSLRAATKVLRSDMVYARHRLGVGYGFSWDRQAVSDEFAAGYIAGRAPLFERFVLGTSSLLRGWNRYEIDPLGGNRMVHNSITYRYRFPKVTAETFYDSGALWSSGQSATLRHSLGFGIRQGVFSAAVAFPLRDARIDPIFMVGMNY